MSVLLKVESLSHIAELQFLPEQLPIYIRLWSTVSFNNTTRTKKQHNIENEHRDRQV
jgi:hypothetical protein